MAINPCSGEEQEFRNLDDVYDVIEDCYIECKQKGFDRVGEALYEQALMFVNIDKIVDDNHQLRIKEYRFCKNFNCPPYPSLNETPAKTIDEFLIIEEEINQYKNRDTKNG